MMEDSEKKMVKAVESEKGIIKDIYDHIKERTSGSFLPAFIISFIVVNWQFFYITFFVSEKYIYNMKINKIQYIYEMYDRLGGRDCSWYIFFGPLVGVFLYYGILPFIDIQISYIKKLFRIFENNKHKLINKKIKDINNEELLDANTKLEILEKKKEINKYDVYKNWDELYDEIKSNIDIGYIMTTKGNIKEKDVNKFNYYNLGTTTNVSIYIGNSFDNESNHANIITLTEKGEYVLNKYKKKDYNEYLKNQDKLKEYDINNP